MGAFPEGACTLGSNLTYAPLVVGADITMHTTQVCPECGETIVFTEDIVQLLVVQPQLLPKQLVFHQSLDDEGDFLYEPYYLHFSCWESVEEQLLEEVEDTPPIEDALSVFQCKVCGSGIRDWEHCGSLTCGEFHVSARNPHGVRGEDFIEAAEADVICLYCLLVINIGIIEFWSDETGGVSQFGECGDCLHARCWRLPAGTCPCDCHTEDTDG